MKTCRIVEMAEEWVSEIEAETLPQDFERGDEPYKLMLARIRHGYTNYMELLRELPDCPADCGDRSWPLDEGECFQREEARDILKRPARDEAEAAYHQWLDTRNKKAP